MTTDQAPQAVKDSALDPISRISEILFGLIMVLTFTGSMSAADIGRDDVKEMLIGAIGCNLAWGIIDAMMFLMAEVTAKGRLQHLIRRLSATNDLKIGRKLVAEALPGQLSEILEAKHLDHIRERVLEISSKKFPRAITGSDLIGALKVFALVFFSILPVIIPFVIMMDPYKALRASNVIAVIMLFWLGRELGRYAGRSPILWGITMALSGALLVSMTIALGG